MNPNMPFDSLIKPIKVKIEFNDDVGTKYSFNVEGTSKDNIAKLIDFAQSLSTNIEEPRPDTNFSKLYGLLESRFRFGSFTSNDVLQAYQLDFNTTTTLSIISTYLSRLSQRGLLTRQRRGSGWSYKLARTEEQRKDMIVQTTPHDLLNTSYIPS